MPTKKFTFYFEDGTIEEYNKRTLLEALRAANYGNVAYMAKVQYITENDDAIYEWIDNSWKEKNAKKKQEQMDYAE